MEYTLTLTFVNSAGDKSNLTISGAKAGVTKDEVNSLMDTIIAKDVFENKGASLVSKYGAQITQRQTTKFDL
ncbi:DUF2922 domain-containing protein [Clostridium folliculivorans]|uniref:DUF2922 domain-containing protein n=1 Tax=Clostridium folliculivorans TaxID=2886038 RepID=A0A9W5Y018_9CLOT|nr:DUF2922 domain-containing protein [Clostridium folliculivorans]GKU24056.1 hypothetical protein CFOLD11_08820 [Clostridium folliculivorans]GKU30169.1 hypothetical protein CFB3_22760 [Clostridium folliculivorans]